MIEIKGIEPGQYNPNHFGGMCSREAAIVRTGAMDFEKGIDTIATTDAPATVVDWERWQVVREVLPMKYCELPKRDKVPLLDSHSRVSIEKVKGSAKNWNKAEHELMTKCFISKTEKDVQTKIDEGHIDSVSIGYETREDNTVEIPKGGTVLIDGDEYKNEFTDGMPMLVRTWFKIKELSLVPIGADEAAKFRAELQQKLSAPGMIETKIKEQSEEIKNLKDQIISITKTSEVKPMEENKLTPEEIQKNERARIAEIEAIAGKFEKNVTNARELKVAAIGSGISADQFRAEIFNKVDFSKPIDTGVGDVDLSRTQLEKYSLMRAINALLPGGNRDSAKLEFEVSDEIAKRSGAAPKGFFVPQVYLNKGVREWMRMNQRTAITTTNAADIIATDLASNLWVDLLRNKMVCRQAGAQMLTGLVGNLDIPKQLATGTFHWVAEQGTGTATNMTTTKLSLTPKDGWAQQSYGRRTFLQTTPSVEALIINDLNNLAALGLDFAGLDGPGTLSPTGIAHTNSVGSVVLGSAGVLTWAKMVEFETDVEVANADVASMAFVTNPRVKGNAKTTLKSSGVAGYIMDGKEINGYPVLSTNQAASGLIVFGDFSQLIYGEWGLTDLQVNPYADNGDVKLTLFVTADVGVRQPGAFSVCANAE